MTTSKRLNLPQLASDVCAWRFIAAELDTATFLSAHCRMGLRQQTDTGGMVAVTVLVADAQMARSAQLRERSREALRFDDGGASVDDEDTGELFLDRTSLVPDEARRS
jgi:hypothetical protein